MHIYIYIYILNPIAQEADQNVNGVYNMRDSLQFLYLKLFILFRQGKVCIIKREKNYFELKVLPAINYLKVFLRILDPVSQFCH